MSSVLPGSVFYNTLGVEFFRVGLVVGTQPSAVSAKVVTVRGGVRNFSAEAVAKVNLVGIAVAGASSKKELF